MPKVGNLSAKGSKAASGPKSGGSFEDLIKLISQPLNQLKSIFQDFVNNIKKTTNFFSELVVLLTGLKLSDLSSWLGKQVPKPSKWTVSALPQGQPLSNATKQALMPFLQKLGQLGGAGGSGAASAASGAAGVAAQFGALLAPIAPYVAVITAAIAAAVAAIVSLPAAIGILLGVLGTFSAVTRSFVEALSPPTVRLFDYVLRNLLATIGNAFLPAWMAMINIVLELTRILAPLANALAPVFTRLITTLGEFLLPLVEIVALFIELLARTGALDVIFQTIVYAVAGVFALLFAACLALIPILTSLAAALLLILTPFMLLGRLLLTVISGTASLLRQLGLGIRGNIPSSVAAPTNAQQSDFQEIARQTNLAAATAVPIGAASERESTLGDVVNTLRTIADSVSGILTFLRNPVAAVVEPVVRSLPSVGSVAAATVFPQWTIARWALGI